MITTTTHSTEIGGVVLEERHTAIRLSVGTVGAGLSYRRPTAVTAGGSPIPIRDVAMTLKLVAAAMSLLLVVALKWRR